MDSKYAKFLLEKTRKYYNLIAQDYTRTRAFIPQDLKDFGRHVNPGERILDSGCASGRFYEALEDKNVDFYGIDFSQNLINIAQKNYPQGKFQVADALNLPFDSNFFDKIFSISVLHNIPSQELQLQYLKEAKRILKPKGLLILRVWDFWKRKKGLKLVFQYFFLKLANRTKLDFFDVFVPWKDSQGNIVAQRYFHCFTKKKLENLIKKAGFKIKESWRAGKDPRTNIYIIAEK